MTTNESYAAEWRRYRELRFAAVVTLLAFFPLLALITLLIRNTHLNQYLGLAADAACVIAVSFTGIRYATWRCPRCGRSFRGLRPYTGRQCFYCSLPKWSETDERGGSTRGGPIEGGLRS